MLARNAILMLILLVAGTKSYAAESQWVSADYVQGRLISSGQKAALELRLADGWHAYWRMPGDGGLAPTFDWAASENLTAATPSWPTPKRISVMGLQSFGYEGGVMLPLAVQAQDAAKDVTLDLKASVMVCKDICVPQDLALRLVMPSAAESPDPYGAIIAHAEQKVPPKDNIPALKIETAVLGPDALVLRAFSQQGFKTADVFVEAGDLYMTAPPAITPDEKDARNALLRIPAPEGTANLAAALAGKKVTVTLTAGGKAIEREFSF